MTDDHLPHLDLELFDRPSADKLASVPTVAHPPRILLLYGSNRERSFSRLLTFEAARLLQAMGAETRIFNPSGLPQVDDAAGTPVYVIDPHGFIILRYAPGFDPGGLRTDVSKLIKLI